MMRQRTISPHRHIERQHMEATIRAIGPHARTGEWKNRGKQAADPRADRLAHQLGEVANGERELANIAHAMLALSLSATDADTADLLASTLVYRLSELPDATLTDLSKEISEQLRKRGRRTPTPKTFDLRDADAGEDTMVRTLAACPKCGSGSVAVRSSKAETSGHRTEYCKCRD